MDIKATSLSLALLCSGCATIITGTSQSVTFTATEPGTRVEVEIGRGSKAATKYEGSTPMTVALSKRKNINVTYRLQDGSVRETELPAGSFNGWFVGNILFGGLIGMAVDGLTGNASHWPDQMHFDARTSDVIADPIIVEGKYYARNSPELRAKRDAVKWTTIDS